MKKIKKIVKKKTSTKPVIKKKKVLKRPLTKPRASVKSKKGELVSSNEIIFDSNVGKTDALFVDNPKDELIQTVEPVETINTQEINFLETTPKDPSTGRQDTTQSQILANLNGHKKPFWQKFLSLFKKL